jgi:hypothetical protein
MKICLVGAEFYHAGGQTDMTQLILSFRNFWNVPKVVIVIHSASYSVPSRSARVKGCDHGALNKTALRNFLWKKSTVMRTRSWPLPTLKMHPPLVHPSEFNLLAFFRLFFSCIYE